jgi:hypothetical protein
MSMKMNELIGVVAASTPHPCVGLTGFEPATT